MRPATQNRRSPATVRTVNLDAITFSQQWVQAWNAQDVEAVLEHFHDDVVFTSPVAATVVPETNGLLPDKASLRRYWTTAMQRLSDILPFVVEGVYQGVDSVVINYRNQRSVLVSEVLKFKDGLVIEGHGTYLVNE